MNRVFLLLLTALVVVSSSFGQTPDPNQEQKLLALVKEVQIQQTQMAENQAKIDEKINELAETIRDARLYSKRAK